MRNFLYWNVILVTAILVSFGKMSAAETLPVQLEFEESDVVVRLGGTTSKRLWLSNTSYEDITVTLSFDMDNSVIPEGWRIELSSDEEFVAENARARVLVRIITNDVAGVAKIVVRGESGGIPTESVTLNARSQDIKKPILNVPSALIFNKVFLGETKTYTTTLANEGDTTLVITNIEILDSEEGFVLEQLEFPISLAPKKLLPLVVHFSPKEKGLLEATLLIVSNTYNEPDTWTMIELRGEGTDIVNSVEERSPYTDLAVTPNPATGEFAVRYSLREFIQSETRVTIMNALGQPLLFRTFKNTGAGEYSERFSTENLPSGRYEVLIQNGLEVNRFPLLIIR